MNFALSKIIWMFFIPGNFLVLLMLIGAFLSVSRRHDRVESGRRICFHTAFLMFFIAIFPVGGWALLPLENHFPAVTPDHVDGIIVIGSDENPVIAESRHQPSVRDAAAYFTVFAGLAKKYPHARLAFAGGEGRLGVETKMTEAEVARETLTTMGVPVQQMVFEDKSRNTRENAAFAAAAVHPKPGEKWLLVTAAFHMPRAIACFRKAGWNVYPAPADYMTDGNLSSDLHFNFTSHLMQLNKAVHEYYGLLAYWAMGYIDTPWPK